MRNKRITLISSITISMMLLSLLGSGRSIAGEPSTGQGPIATVIIEADVVTWEPQVENGGLVLTIAGPGDWYLRQEYQSGDRPTFKPVDGRGKALSDGVYNYELLLLPAKWEAPAEYDEAQRGLEPSKGAAEARVQSGSFSILNGGFVTQDAVEESDARGDPAQSELQDVLHYDDVIITGSLCTGFDCQEGESFGFDTHILKEHNLRIYFNDTSYTASYPTNSWRITINDNTNGGASYFSVDDVDDGTSIFKIEAGAPSNSLYVDDSGRVGLRESIPVVSLHMWADNTPTVRLDQDPSSWGPQVWDVAGNEYNFFIRDVTNGSELPFRIKPGAPTNSLFIKSDGKVGLGTQSPTYPVHLKTRSSTDATFVAERTGGATALFSAGASGVQLGSSTNHNVELLVNNSSVFLLDANGNVTLDGLLTEASDQALKENFRSVEGQEVLEGITQLPISTWNFISDDQAVQHMGPVAQDFYAVFGLGADDRHIAPLDANAVALAGVQELYQMVLEREAQAAQLQQQNVDLEARVAELQQRDANLEAQVAQLERLVHALIEAQNAAEGSVSVRE